MGEPTTRTEPFATPAGERRKNQSLRGRPCPYCRAGRLRLREDGTNECPACGGEVVTEWEWRRRQAAAGKAVPA
jgi:uncharacterized Zn finger protein (UPF0148 family)